MGGAIEESLAVRVERRGGIRPEWDEHLHALLRPGIRQRFDLVSSNDCKGPRDASSWTVKLLPEAVALSLFYEKTFWVRRLSFSDSLRLEEELGRLLEQARACLSPEDFCAVPRLIEKSFEFRFSPHEVSITRTRVESAMADLEKADFPPCPAGARGVSLT